MVFPSLPNLSCKKDVGSANELSRHILYAFSAMSLNDWILDHLLYYVIDTMVMCVVSSTIYLYCLGMCGYSSVGEIICQCSPACKNLVQELQHLSKCVCH